MQEVKLLDCPFCGCAPIFEPDEDGCPFVMCPSCEFQMPAYRKGFEHMAIAAWNRRTPVSGEEAEGVAQAVVLPPFAAPAGLHSSAGVVAWAARNCEGWDLIDDSRQLVNDHINDLLGTDVGRDMSPWSLHRLVVTPEVSAPVPRMGGNTNPETPQISAQGIDHAKLEGSLADDPRFIELLGEVQETYGETCSWQGDPALQAESDNAEKALIAYLDGRLARGQQAGVPEAPKFRVAVHKLRCMYDGNGRDPDGDFEVMVMNTAISKGDWNPYSDPGVKLVYTDESETSCNHIANAWGDFFGVGVEYCKDGEAG